MILSPGRPLPSVRCQARGAVFGRGAGVVVLKSLAAALADGRPRARGHQGVGDQQRRRAEGGVHSAERRWTGAGDCGGTRERRRRRPIRISYVEAHGTGTPQGDPIEIDGTHQCVSTGPRRAGRCAIGSVKANIGHLDAAAGVTGLIKTVLMLQHRELPPTLHFTEPNPQIDFAGGPFRVNDRLVDWRADGGPRRAGVSSFGIGGTNAHVVLEEAPAIDARDASVERPCHLLTLQREDARGAPSVLAERYADHLAVATDRLADICHTAATGRTHWSHRAAVLVDSADRTAERLRFLAQDQVDIGVTVGQAGAPPRVAFLFAGQGGQYAGMGRQLYDTQPVFRAAIDRCAASVRDRLNRPLLEVMFAGAADDADDPRDAVHAAGAVRGRVRDGRTVAVVGHRACGRHRPQHGRVRGGVRGRRDQPGGRVAARRGACAPHSRGAGCGRDGGGVRSGAPRGWGHRRCRRSGGDRRRQWPRTRRDRRRRGDRDRAHRPLSSAPGCACSGSMCPTGSTRR